MNPAVITAAITGIEALIRLIQTTRETLRKSGELTPEQDAEFDLRMELMFQGQHWTDKPQ